VGSQAGSLPRAEIKTTTPAARRHQGEEYRVTPEGGKLGGKTKMGNGSTGSKHENEQDRAGPFADTGGNTKISSRDQKKDPWRHGAQPKGNSFIGVGAGHLDLEGNALHAKNPESKI
jgi:hypothetical protein